MGNPAVWDYPLCMWMDRLTRSLRAHRGAQLPKDERFSYASVAVLIRPDGDLLFIRRAARTNDPWSGHMAFPGGRIDPDDDGPEAAVRREVFEEIGVDLSEASLLGMLDQVASPDLAPRVCVTPFVFLLTGEPNIQIAADEVASVHWYPIDVLQNSRSSFLYTFHGVVYDLPCIDQDDRRIWGMTLRIVDEILKRINDETP